MRKRHEYKPCPEYFYLVGLRDAARKAENKRRYQRRLYEHIKKCDRCRLR